MDFLLNSLLSRVDIAFVTFVKLLIQALIIWNLFRKMGFRGVNFWILLILAATLPSLTLLAIGFKFFQWPIHSELAEVKKENEDLKRQIGKLRDAFAKRQQQRKPPQSPS